MIASAPVIGRRFERERIDAFVSASTSDARALILRGEPGIGKTTLWRYAVSRAHEERLRVLATRPAEEEMPLSGVGLVDLFEETDLDPDALALGEPFVTGRVVLDGIRSIARAGPVVLAIDDLQWLDPVSARALRYAFRRLKDDPVTVLGAIRADPIEPDPLALARILPAHRLGTLEVHPLGLEDIRHVIGGSISRPLLRRIYDASGGNPLYAVEMARNLESMDRTGISIDTLPLPDSLQTVIGDRVSSQSDELFVLLETMSVVGRTTVMRIREMLAPADVDPMLIDGQREGLVVVGDDLSVRFSHPLIASAVYDRIDPIRRRELH
ncbi:MAG TPA: AAA family ATPase, partial [Actinomycetota bacterium]